MLQTLAFFAKLLTGTFFSKIHCHIVVIVLNCCIGIKRIGGIWVKVQCETFGPKNAHVIPFVVDLQRKRRQEFKCTWTASIHIYLQKGYQLLDTCPKDFGYVSWKRTCRLWKHSPLSILIDSVSKCDKIGIWTWSVLSSTLCLKLIFLRQTVEQTGIKLYAELVPQSLTGFKNDYCEDNEEIFDIYRISAFHF